MIWSWIPGTTTVHLFNGEIGPIKFFFCKLSLVVIVYYNTQIFVHSDGNNNITSESWFYFIE